MNIAQFFARWRVRVGYPLAIVVLFFARPTPLSVIQGAAIGTIGLLIRASAAGYLRKQEVLAVTGPYAYTRNPLYFGSAILALGAGIAAHSWTSALILVGYFALFYSVVMRREELELGGRHGAAFAAYADAVPLFFPRLTPAQLASSVEGEFSFAQYQKNREYRAIIGFVFLLIMLLVIWRVRIS